MLPHKGSLNTTPLTALNVESWPMSTEAISISDVQTWYWAPYEVAHRRMDSHDDDGTLLSVGSSRQVQQHQSQAFLLEAVWLAGVQLSVSSRQKSGREDETLSRPCIRQNHYSMLRLTDDANASPLVRRQYTGNKRARRQQT